MCDLDDVRQCTGFIPKANYQPQPLLSLLAELASRTVQVYYQDLQAWFQEHQDYTPFMDWLQQIDILVLSYIKLLSSNTPPNGLEVLAAMTALCFHITIIQGDQVWMSRPGEVQITDLTLLLLQEGVVFCDHINIVPQASLSESLPVSGVPFLGE